MPKTDIQFLEEAILAVHGCKSTYVESVPVHEIFEGKTAWKGTVEVFNLTGHPKADRCYAWSYGEGKNRNAVAVLQIPPVDSPQSAVTVAIAAAVRNKL